MARVASVAPYGVYRALLWCGVAAPLYYAAINVFVPTLWPEYSVASHTVSELSAVDAPTRAVWVALVTGYSLLILAFGWGVRAVSATNRALRWAGAAILAQGVISMYWPPMHLREVIAAGGGSLTDTLHIVWTMVTLALMLTAILCGAAGLGARFRTYSAATIAVFMVFGALTAIDAPGINTNTPTPFIGVWERINIAAYMLWQAVFATALRRRPPVARGAWPVAA